MKTLKTIIISGTITGLIWMPCEEHCKHFKRVYTPTSGPFSDEWTGLRDAVCEIINDGNFRNARIEYATIEVTWLLPNGERYVKEKALVPGKLIADCFSTII